MLQTSPHDQDNNTDVLSAIIIAVSTGIIGVLIVVCVITVVIYVRLLRRKLRPDPPQNLYAEVGNANPIYEAVDKDLRCIDTKLNESKSITNSFYVNMCE